MQIPDSYLFSNCYAHSHFSNFRISKKFVHKTGCRFYSNLLISFFPEIFRWKKTRLQIQDIPAQLWISSSSNFQEKRKKKNLKKFSLKAHYIKHAISGQKKTWSSFFFHQNSLKQKKTEKKTETEAFFSAFNLKRLSTKTFIFHLT